MACKSPGDCTTPPSLSLSAALCAALGQASGAAEHSGEKRFEHFLILFSHHVVKSLEHFVSGHLLLHSIHGTYRILPVFGKDLVETRFCRSVSIGQVQGDSRIFLFCWRSAIEGILLFDLRDFSRAFRPGVGESSMTGADYTLSLHTGSGGLHRNAALICRVGTAIDSVRAFPEFGPGRRSREKQEDAD